jgi:adenine-specific DNA-methyltransferase
MPKAPSPKARTPVLANKHKDKRANIPTEELRDFVADDEKTPKKILYLRDPSLDPQLVWRDKDEQDSHPLEVPAVPIYIQEKIHPQVIIENLRESAKDGEKEQTPELFSDFNGIKFEQLIEFYQHKDGVNWANRMILGDSLLVMTSLAEKEGLKGQVQMIYIDPPYGIKFGSNWQVSTRKRDVKDGKAEDATRQPEQIRAFRDTWKLGIHSYLAYLRDRLCVARDLLTESGSVFVQIGVENSHLVRSLLDEVFGSENFCAFITFKKTGASTDDLLPCSDDYLIWYARDHAQVKFRQVYRDRKMGDDGTEEYKFVQCEDGATRTLSDAELLGVEPIANGAHPFRYVTCTSSHHYALGEAPFEFQGRTFTPGGRYWSTSPTGMTRLAFSDRLIGRDKELAYRRYLEDFSVIPFSTTWTDTMMSSRSEN